MKNTENEIVIALHQNVNNLDKLTSNISNKHNITFSQFMVLEALYTKGNMTVGQVRDYILSSIGTITLIVDNLVKRSYVERLSDKHDRRVSILHLTNKGLDIISEIAPLNKKRIKHYISALDENEKKELLYLLKKIRHKI